MIDNKTLITLEYDKILVELTELAQTAPGRKQCEELRPSDNYDEVMLLQLSTQLKQE